MHPLPELRRHLLAYDHAMIQIGQCQVNDQFHFFIRFKTSYEINIDYVDPEPIPLPEIIKRGNVMSAAVEMQKTRDDKLKKESPEAIRLSNLQKRTKLI